MHFSNSGGFLHIISLALPPQSGETRNINSYAHLTPMDSTEIEYLYIAVSCVTYEISPSDSKPYSSDPTFCSDFTICVGSYKAVGQIPFGVTWTSNEAYLAINDYVLKLYKINLYPSDAEDSVNVEIPRNWPALPDSAQSRVVQYFPQDEGITATLIVGSRAKSKAPLPFGVIVLAKSIGPWVKLTPTEDFDLLRMPELALDLTGQEGRSIVFDDSEIPLQLVSFEEGKRVFVSEDWILKLAEKPGEYEISFHFDGQKGLTSFAHLKPQSIFSGQVGPSRANSVMALSTGPGGVEKQRYPMRMSTFAPLYWLGETGSYWRRWR